MSTTGQPETTTTNTAPTSTMATSNAGATTSTAAASSTTPVPPEAGNATGSGPSSAAPPTTTSADTTTSGTATTTTASTTTASGTTTTTTDTTTTTTTTTTTGEKPTATQNQFNDCVTRCNNCLFLVRRLRSRVKKMHDVVMNACFVKGDTLENVEMYRKFELMNTEIKETYDRLDYYSRRLPRVIPAIDSVKHMQKFYALEHNMQHAQMGTKIDKMIDASNWNEGQYQIFYYLSELLRLQSHKKRYTLLNAKPIPMSNYGITYSHGHMLFEAAYRGMKKEIAQKQLGIYPKTLQQTPTSMIIEFKFGVAGGKGTSERDVVYTMKFLIMEKHGVVEYLNIIGVGEEWIYDCDYSEKRLNPIAPSRFLVFKQLTKQANIHLLNNFGTSSRWTANTLIQFVSIFGKMRDVFSTKCKLCKRILKDYMPPLCFEIRNPHQAQHEACKFAAMEQNKHRNL